MEFVDGRKVVRRQALDVFSRRFQRRQDGVAESGFFVMTGDRLR